ncbi:MAG: hypothetical protein ACYDHY_06575 [Acidiferrobacterales bacterium]
MPTPPKKDDEEPSTLTTLSTLLLIGIFEIVFTAILCFGSVIQSMMVAVLTKNQAYGLITFAFCVMAGLAGRKHMRMLLLGFLLSPKKEGKNESKEG